MLNSCSTEEDKSSEIKQEIESQPSDTQPQDFGDLKVFYSPTDNAYYKELEQYFKEQRLFEDTADELNKQIALPVDIPIVFSECKEVNAFYDPQTFQIVMCYELIENLFYQFTPLIPEEELDKSVLDTTFFVFYHEMGHALAHILNLPITGREEDSVDQLATIVLTNAGEEGEDAAIRGANWFLVQASQTNIDELAFWDEHSLDIQRFYDIACIVYGKNPERNAYLVNKGYLPEQRATRCPFEYQKISNSWTQLLTPYLKNQ